MKLFIIFLLACSCCVVPELGYARDVPCLKRETGHDGVLMRKAVHDRVLPRLRGGEDEEDTASEDNDDDVGHWNIEPNVPPRWKDLEKDWKHAKREMYGANATADDEEDDEDVNMPHEKDPQLNAKEYDAYLKELQEKYPFVSKDRIATLLEQDFFQEYRLRLQLQLEDGIHSRRQPKSMRNLSPIKDSTAGPQQALWYACQNGASDEEIFRLAEQADVNASDPDWKNFTALHFAAERGRVNVVETLIALEACSNIRDSRGLTPDLVALSKGHQAVRDIFTNAKELCLLVEESEPEEELPPIPNSIAEECFLKSIPDDEEFVALREP